MPKDWSAQISHVNFRCGACRKAFEGVPDLIEDDPEQEHHPYRYFAHCPHCGEHHQPQAGWERALLKAHQHSTGPKTPQGVAAVSANLEGHPTPHEALRTRFNAMKHGATARTATYFPAKAGGYAFCARCDVDRDWCSKQPACVKQTEIFMLHHAAFEQRDPKVLTAIHADMHAALMATLQMCIQEVLGLGVLIKAPKVELDREGNPVTLTYTAEDGSKRYIYHYYGCRNSLVGKHRCGFGKMRAELFDEWMLAELLDQVMTPDRMADVVAQAYQTRETWAKDRSDRRKTIVAELRVAEKARSNLFSILELHGQEAPNLGDITKRLREWNDRIRSLEAGLVDLENERMSVNEQPEVDPVEAAEVLREIVLNCEDPKKLREFVGSFVREITVTADEVMVDYHPECLVRHNHRSTIHSANKWLLDLGSNQGPTD